jgi:hypothetical protein
MVNGNKKCFSRSLMWAGLAAICAAVAAYAPQAIAGGGLGGGAVGGVRVDVASIVSKISDKEMDTLRKAREEALRAVPSDIAKASDMRKISLRKMAEAIIDHQTKKAGAPLTDDFIYLAGLQRIQYIFVYPEQKDIVIAGPAAGWKINEQAEVVGANTGLPVLRLDHLLVALQTAEQARETMISCSIDPTPEGIQKLRTFLGKQKTMNAGVKEGVEASLGKQNVTLTGVPATSRYAHVLLAADYRMKRYAMNLDASPVKGMPSYLELIRNAKANVSDDMSPRWWIEADYQPLLTDGEGLAWEIRPGVKVMSEDEKRDAAGNVKGTGKVNALAKKWADTMTEKYKELAAKESIFAELQNCMDLSVAAALIAKERLAEKAGMDMAIYTENERLMVDGLPTPKHVNTEVSMAKSGREWLITASGGVQFHSWSVANKQEASEATKKAREAAAAGANWWWD